MPQLENVKKSNKFLFIILGIIFSVYALCILSTVINSTLISQDKIEHNTGSYSEVLGAENKKLIDSSTPTLAKSTPTLIPTNTPIPTSSPTSVPLILYYEPQTQTACSGASALCRDGSCSYSLHRSGTCSHHGGVSIWNP